MAKDKFDCKEGGHHYLEHWKLLLVNTRLILVLNALGR